MTLYWVRGALNLMIGVLVSRPWEHSETHRDEYHVTTEAEIWSDASANQGTPRITRATRSKERGVQQVLPQSFQKEPNLSTT